MVLLPPLAFFVAYRFCLGLQRSDREVLEHGIETGIIKRMPNGQYIEIHQPLGPVDGHGHPIPLEYQGAAIPKKMNKLGSAGKPGSGSLVTADPIEESEALEAALHHGEREQLTMLTELQNRVHGNGSSGNGSSGNGEAH
jgi:ubiquinol-cytochrome c reductase cytochrome b subunit